MPTYFTVSAISGHYPDIAEIAIEIVCLKVFLIFGIFYPTGEPILLGGVGWRLRCSPFAVVYYSFMGYFLAVAAILTRE